MRLGEPTLFIRFSQCNLRCNFCDTKYAWQTGKEMTVAQILEKVDKIHASFPAPWVCLTGGEPLLQNIGGLVRALKTKGFLIQVETNGTFAPLSGVNWHTLSPKPPDYFFHPEFKKRAKEVKLVMTGELDLAILNKLRQSFPEKIPILLQPRSNRQTSAKRAARLLKKAVAEGMKNIRLTAQIHKIFGWR